MDSIYLEFSNTLAGLYYTQQDIAALLVKAQFNPGKYTLTGSSGVIFTLMIRQMENDSPDTVKKLALAALSEYPNNPVIKNIAEGLKATVKSVYDGAPLTSINTTSKAEFEKITNKQSTLLPISFLEKGMQMSKCVARVVTPTGLGTGFLISNDNLFITNNHVIDSPPTEGEGYKVQFNYQAASDGLPMQYEEYEIDESVFHTNKDDDWTVVKIKKNPSDKYGYIPLIQTNTNVNDFVNIIQHPGGEYKQIALYHNLVTKVDNRVVQYLTDTLPGSSGSPVFNSAWDVVALHHSGGFFPIENGSKILCNEGININKIIPVLKNLNLII